MEKLSTMSLPFLEEATQLMRARAKGPVPLAYVRTYGCQQNVADSEKIKGVLAQMGFAFTQGPEDADLALFNTCAVREHAEDRVFGNVGALKNQKRKNPDLLIAVCGCMTEREQVVERLKKSFPFVDIVFGTRRIHQLPEMLYAAASGSRRVFPRGGEPDDPMEGLPIRRENGARAWVTIMTGCDNFCSYCVVPYVRGREKSRAPEAVLAECRSLVEAGYREITLLGQNVDSYGKGLEPAASFPRLLQALDRLEGDYWLRFMTSHPKDAGPALFDVMAAARHIPRCIHLPFQSGNDRVLRAMNRRYNRERYLSLIRYARSVMPDISFTSDVIVGFPGETYEEFQDTLSLIREVEFTNLFTFIYSPRPGTPAAQLPDPVSHQEKTEWFAQLLRVQEEIAQRKGAAMVGRAERVLVESREGKSGLLAGRTAGGLVVLFPGDDGLIGQFTTARITQAQGLRLQGELAESKQ